MLIVGDKEIETRTISVRLRNGKELKGVSLEKLYDVVSKDIKERLLESPLMSET
jgi:threonyl-tRNA synthetase